MNRAAKTGDRTMLGGVRFITERLPSGINDLECKYSRVASWPGTLVTCVSSESAALGSNPDSTTEVLGGLPEPPFPHMLVGKTRLCRQSGLQIPALPLCFLYKKSLNFSEASCIVCKKATWRHALRGGGESQMK